MFYFRRAHIHSFRFVIGDKKVARGDHFYLLQEGAFLKRFLKLDGRSLCSGRGIIRGTVTLFNRLTNTNLLRGSKKLAVNGMLQLTETIINSCHFFNISKDPSPNNLSREEKLTHRLAPTPPFEHV